MAAHGLGMLVTGLGVRFVGGRDAGVVFFFDGSVGFVDAVLTLGLLVFWEFVTLVCEKLFGFTDLRLEAVSAFDGLTPLFVSFFETLGIFDHLHDLGFGDAGAHGDGDTLA